MLRILAIAILVLSELCIAIRVPVVWNSDSEVKHEADATKDEQKSIPVEYFAYTAEKPQFAVDIAAFHGVQSPEQHYKAYPIRPYTGNKKPDLGKHKLHDESKTIFKQYQDFTKSEALTNPIYPAAVSYDVYHPYKAEEPALQEIYKDPILDKIRNDIRDSQYKLQKYENEAGKPEITEDEYLESPEQTDRKKFPHKNIQADYEVHKPQRRPVYYRLPPKYSQREQFLNHKFRHPWNQHNAKIRPVHYQPIKNHIQRLKQHHALKYDDERNEYPQVFLSQNFAEPTEGYDIYEKGKDKYVQLRNNVDESINKAVKENRPTIYRKLELLQNNGDRKDVQISDDNDNDDEEEFVPIKNYAQVRKTETTKHLPKSAAYDDSENFDELKNAPRLREAIKSTKAQTVYTEEGYEDAAYDHAGEQKHASEVEGHGGYLKEKEKSGGKYKIPSVAASYQDSSGNEYRDLIEHGEKWKNDDKDKEKESEAEDYSEDEQDHSVEAEIYEDVTGERSKRDSNSSKNTKAVKDHSNEINDEHEVIKRETKFNVPEINLNSTFLTEDEIIKMAKPKAEVKKEDIKDKYPYYFKNLKMIHKNSPLRYAENLNFIPKKSEGGTEFYDSRSQFKCPEVDEKVDAIPEKLKNGEHPDSGENDSSDDKSQKKGQGNFDHLKENPRLKGLGDKIDCFKVKYFGKNPLDSPFFKEDIISNPDPVTIPNLSTYKLKLKDPQTGETKTTNIFDLSEKLKEDTKTDVFVLLDQLRNGHKELQESVVKSNDDLKATLVPPHNLTLNKNTELSRQFNIYSDVFDAIKNLQKPLNFDNVSIQSKILHPNVKAAQNNVTYSSYQNKEDVTKSPMIVRKKRAAPFVYEPYKIIRDGHVQDSKYTTTTSNISPLIKQLQSSKVVDKVTKINHDKEQLFKRNVPSVTYKDVGRKEREKSGKNFEESSSHTFVDVNTDKRRGEPRYELRHVNHKSEYSPVENKKAMSLEDYKNATKNTIIKIIKNKQDEMKSHSLPEPLSTRTSMQRSTTVRPYFDVSQFLPNSGETHKTAASNTVSKRVRSTTLTPKADNISEKLTSEEVEEDDEDEQDYEEYDDEDENLTTTTTTQKPSFRKRRLKVSTTTAKPPDEVEDEPELPQLRLITRFRNHGANLDDKKKEEHTEKPPKQKFDYEQETDPLKYREKKKKSSKSTLVTDTKTYGDNDDDMREDEVDALIGVKHDMNEYKPHYEKQTETNKKEKSKELTTSSEEDDEEYNDDDIGDDDEYDDDEDFDRDDEEEEDDIEENDDEPKPVTTTEATKVSHQIKTMHITTPEPTKRTLVITTDALPSTTEAQRAKLEHQPMVMRKKIEIHTEMPVNKSSPHVTQFKQDIKEVEIIKEIPSKKVPTKKLQKNLEALELYKDDNLAKDINKLGGVEIFKENLDLRKGPKHGGNYRSAKLIKLPEETTTTSRPLHERKVKVTKEDTETSQSKNTKLIDLGDELPALRLHGGNLKSINDVRRSKSPNTTARNAKLEIVDYIAEVVTENMHGGNLKANRNKDRRGRARNAKLIEFDDDDDDNSRNRMHGGNFQSYDSSIDDDRSSHGSGFRSRSAKLLQGDDSKKEDATQLTTTRSKGETSTHARTKAAGLLNSFVQAAPILTTTPAYILDPSKRMYYYVDA